MTEHINTASVTGTLTIPEWAKGTDGYSPVANVVETPDGAKITITDKKGTTTATVKNGIDGVDGKDGIDGKPGKDGTDGTDGKDGVSPTAKVEETPSGATITVTDANGTTTATVEDGKTGPVGESGVYRGTEEPTDPEIKVWIDPSGSASDALATEDYVISYVDAQIGSISGLIDAINGEVI